MPTTYEFVVETLDYYEDCGDNPDIIDTSGFDTMLEAIDYAATIDELPWRICLRRDTGNEYEGLTERYYAYPDANGKLPERMESGHDFNDGPLVPKEFQKYIFPNSGNLK